MHEGFIFYRSFAEATEGLPAEQYKSVMVAVTRYGLDGIIPEDLDPVSKAMFTLMKPQIDANNARREAGRKGGVAKASNAVAKDSKVVANFSKAVANDSEAEAEVKQIVAEPVKEKEKEKVKEKVKEKEKHKHGAFAHVLLSDDEYEKLKADYGANEAEAAIEYLDEYIERKGYSTKSHYLAIRKWVFDAIKREQLQKQELAEREKRLNGAKPKDGIKRNNDLDAWLKQKTAEKLNRGIS